MKQNRSAKTSNIFALENEIESKKSKKTVL